MRLASFPKRLAAVGVFFFLLNAGCAGRDEGSPPDPEGAAGAAGSTPTGGTSGSAGTGSGGSAPTGGTGGDDSGGGGQGNTAGQGTAGGPGGRRRLRRRRQRRLAPRAARAGGGAGGRGGTGTAGRGGDGRQRRHRARRQRRNGRLFGRNDRARRHHRRRRSDCEFVGNITTSNAVDTDGKMFSHVLGPDHARERGQVGIGPVERGRDLQLAHARRDLRLHAAERHPLQGAHVRLGQPAAGRQHQRGQRQELDDRVLQALPEHEADRRRQRAAAAHDTVVRELDRRRHQRQLAVDHERVQVGARGVPERDPDPERLQHHRVERRQHALHRHRQGDQGGAARPSTRSARRPTTWTTARSP